MKPRYQTIRIPVQSVVLDGFLGVPENARGLVIFAHGSGSSRLSPRNRLVADVLADAGFATLLFDLLTSGEDKEYANRFDIPLLSERLVAATQWAKRKKRLRGLPVGYFGASTGSAAALSAAARLGERVKAVVSRGGRPDMVMDILDQVRAPTLFLVGELDTEVLELNRKASARLRGAKELLVVPGATHLFEEPGTLEEVARLAGEWFARYLA